MKNFFLTLMVSLSFYNVAISCSCSGPAKPFCAAINERSIIIKCVVTDKPGLHDMEVSVMDHIYGEMLDSDTLVILGQDGVNCAEDVGLFAVGDTLLLDIFSVNTVDATTGEEYDYSIGGCDIKYLRIEGSNIVGNNGIGNTIEDYGTFINSIQDCIDFTSTTDELELVDFKLYPNPVVNMLYIECSQSDNYTVQVVDIQSGSLVYSESLSMRNSYQMDMSEFEPGVYLMRIENERHSFVSKLVKL